MKKIILLCILAFSFLFSHADHNAGGKVSWKCIKSGTNSGKFIFTLHLYRFCTGIPLSGFASLVSTSPAGNISMTRISQSDISPGCYLGQEINCNAGPPKEDYAIEEHVYQSAAITLNATPPAAGWSFQWNSCCRPSPAIYNKGFLVDNLEPQNQSYRIQAIMYPYQNKSANPCYDSSPTFAETPATIICTRFEFTYNHNAEDEENDSLYFEWTTPLLSNGNPVSYATHLNTSQVTPRANGGNFIVPSPGFSSTVPLPWAHPNMNPSNQPATLNPVTGEITFLSYTPGSYATAIRCDAFKCGTKVASIFIDIPVFLIDCQPLPPPFAPGTYNTPPDVTITYKTIQSTNLNVSVLAGEYVEFEVEAEDLEFLPGFTQQTNTMYASSSQFGTNFVSTSLGCKNAPCATMNTNSSGPPTGYYVPADKNWQGVGGLKSAFKWQTDCNHLAKQINSCFVRSNVYTFIFKVLDDYCPAPGANFVTASVTVNAPDPIPPPKLKCITLLQNGDVQLSWNIPLDTALDTNNSFRKYVLFRAFKRDTTEYTAIDTFLNPTTISYTDVGANAHLVPKHYFIMGVSSCNDQSQLVDSDTLTAMNLTATAIAGGDSVQIEWSSFIENNVFPSSTIQHYKLWQIYNNDTTLATITTTNNLKLPIFFCSPALVSYFVTVEDTSLVWGCTSFSNSDTAIVGDNLAPIAPFNKGVTIEDNGDVIISWSPNSDSGVYVYYIRENGILIDSVFAPDSSYTIPKGTNIGLAPITYSITPRDSCNNLGTAGILHTTFENSIVDAIRCANDREITIGFTAYTGIVIDKYIIYADTGSGYYAVDSIDPALIVAPYSYVFSKFSPNPNLYKIQVQAFDINNSLISKSSIDTITMITIPDTVIDPPELKCVQILPNGNIKIEWFKPNNPVNNFDSYHIYHSVDGLNYSILDSINSSIRSGNGAWDSTRYIHIAPNLNQSHYYKVNSRSGCYGFTLSSKSLQVLRTLNLDNPQPISGTINELNWQYLTTPNTAGNFEIMRAHPTNTPFSIIKSLGKNSSTTQDSLKTCKDSARYFIQIDENGCKSISNIVTAYYNDKIPPPKPFLDSVSVINDTNTIIGWRNDASMDATVYYLIKKGKNGAYTIIDTLTGNSTSQIVIADKGCYALVPEDSCGNTRFGIKDFDYHCTIGVDVEIDKCDQSFIINWSPYTSFQSGTNVMYEVYSGINGTGFTLLGNTDQTSYRFEEPISGNTYCFYVRGREKGGTGTITSTSDSVCVSSVFLDVPEYAYMQHVTVRDSGKIEVSMWHDSESDIEEYHILRGTDTSNLKLINTILAPNILTPADAKFSFIDKTPLTSIKSYYYKVGIVDPCGIEILRSNYGKSILLNVEADNQAKKNILSWSAYEGWLSGVLNYKIYRKLESDKYKYVGSVNGNTFEYEDDVSDLVEQSQGIFCYYVQANEATPYFPDLTESDTSLSNEVCVVQYPLFFIPTSFTPGAGNSPGLNDIFKPEGVFVDYENYNFEIFNRWGEKIFETQDFLSGWNGKINGKQAPSGAYVYIVNYQGADGKEFEQKGTFSITK